MTGSGSRFAEHSIEIMHIYRDITDRCFINAPFDQLRDDLLDLFLENRFRPEIGLEGDCLWNRSREEFRAMAQTLREHELACTLHAPFFDLAPGGIDPVILKVTRDKLRRAFELIEVFQPRSIVCHLGYDENKHAHNLDRWLETAVTTWRELLAIAAATGTPVMFENTYETGPEIHALLFERLNAPGLGFCLDMGHLSAYAGTGWHPWLDRLLPRLGQLHLHDNRGTGDDHIAIGAGCIDFCSLFDFLDRNNKTPLITLEPHSKEDLWLSLKNLTRMNLFP